MSAPGWKFATELQAIEVIRALTDDTEGPTDLWRTFNLLHISTLGHAETLAADALEAERLGDIERKNDALHFEAVYRRMAFTLFCLRFLTEIANPAETNDCFISRISGRVQCEKDVQGMEEKH